MKKRISHCDCIYSPTDSAAMKADIDRLLFNYIVNAACMQERCLTETAAAEFRVDGYK